MSESQYPRANDQKPSSATTCGKPEDKSSLFACIPYTHGVAITACTANKIQSLALAELLSDTKQLGTFRQLVSDTSSEVRIQGRSIDAVEAVLSTITEESLEPYVRSIEQARHEVLEKEAADKAVMRMSLPEFGKLLCERSNSRVRTLSGPVQGQYGSGVVTLKFQSVDLLPVTHFKALARFAPYDSRERVFVYTESCEADSYRRLELLPLAGKIARSTKKVTSEDIAARRAKRRAQLFTPTDDDIGQYIIDCFGWGVDKPEHIAAAVKALTGR
jgi:hypothetical protein